MLKKIKERAALWARDHIHPEVRRNWTRMASTWAMTLSAGLSGLLAIWTYFEGKVPDWLFVSLAVIGPMIVYGARAWNQHLSDDSKGLDLDA